VVRVYIPAADARRFLTILSAVIKLPPAMAIEHLVLYFLACGAVTFPLTLLAVRLVAALSPSGRFARKIDASFEKILSVSIMIWIVGGLVFYAVSLHLERQKSCQDQRTTQLTYECRKLFGLEE